LNCFDEWWSNGSNVGKKTHFGLLADDNKFDDSIIIDKEGFNNFKEAIALHVTQGEILINNKEDWFLAGGEIDFNYECLVVIKAAVVDKVLYSDMFQCYVLYLTDKSLDPQGYCAVICKRNGGLHGKYKFSVIGKKSIPQFIRRLRVYNDEY
jgi:hypothetical protein